MKAEALTILTFIFGTCIIMILTCWQTIEFHRSTEWSKFQALQQFCSSPHDIKYNKICNNLGERVK